MTENSLTLDALLALEHRGWESLTRHDGGRFYGALMTADAVMILVNGMVLDLDTLAGALDDSPAWSDFSLEESRLVPMGESSAALVYRATAARDGEGSALLSSNSPTDLFHVSQDEIRPLGLSRHSS